MEPQQAILRSEPHEPLHDWYPYLEGYTPALVESVHRNYCRGARSVLDPFGGAGTTPLATSNLGLCSFYCEVNPLLRLRPGGVAVFHLGASRKCNMAEALMAIARRWYHVADVCTENVGHCQSHGIRDKGTVVRHQYRVLE
jgi:hypothetical protein